MFCIINSGVTMSPARAAGPHRRGVVCYFPRCRRTGWETSHLRQRPPTRSTGAGGDDVSSALPTATGEASRPRLSWPRSFGNRGDARWRELLIVSGGSSLLWASLRFKKWAIFRVRIGLLEVTSAVCTESDLKALFLNLSINITTYLFPSTILPA